MVFHQSDLAAEARSIDLQSLVANLPGSGIERLRADIVLSRGKRSIWHLDFNSKDWNRWIDPEDSPSIVIGFVRIPFKPFAIPAVKMKREGMVWVNHPAVSAVRGYPAKITMST